MQSAGLCCTVAATVVSGEGGFAPIVLKLQQYAKVLLPSATGYASLALSGHNPAEHLPL